MITNSDSAHTPSSRRIDLRPIGTAAIALGMVLSTAIEARSWHDVRYRPEKHNIRITGSAKKRIVSDLIQWQSVIDARASDRAAACRTGREGRDKAVAFLIAQGITVTSEAPDYFIPSLAISKSRCSLLRPRTLALVSKTSSALLATPPSENWS